MTMIIGKIQYAQIEFQMEGKKLRIFQAQGGVLVTEKTLKFLRIEIVKFPRICENTNLKEEWGVGDKQV